MREAILAILALLCINAQAQMKIDGRHVSLDTITNTLLATIPERLFDTDATLLVQPEQGWTGISIATVPSASPEGFFSFFNITAESKWHVTLTAADGTTREANLQFTFLPIVHLLGTFGNDYTEGTFIFTHPDSLRSDTLTASIRWRGGTTNAANKHKRNYKVKFPADLSFMGMREDNNWMLDAGQPDVFRMRNRIAMDLWNDMARKPYHADKKPNARNGVSGKMVELFLNAEYRGIYNFSEYMDRKQLKLKKLDEKSGEIHGCLYKGKTWDHTQMFGLLNGYDNTEETLWGYEVKYPDLSDNDTTDWAPLVEANNYAIKCTDDDFAANIGDYFDLPVLVDYSLFASITNAVDNSGKNMYWAIYDKTETKRLTPTPWDLDATFGQRWGGLLTGGDEDLASPEYMTDVDVFVFYRLYKNIDDFNRQLNQRYQELHQPGGVLSTDSLISRFTHYYNAVKRSGAAQRETDKWNHDSDVWGDTIDFDKEYAYICDWIKTHMGIIDQTTFPLYYTKEFFDFLSIGQPSASHQATRDIYDLQGRKMNGQPKRGIYIQGGKKFVVK